MIPPVLIAIILFVVTAYLSWRDLRLGLYLFVLTLPLNNRLVFSLGIPRFIPVRVVIYALIIVSLGKLFDRVRERDFFVEFKKVTFSQFNDPIFMVLFTLLLVRLISISNSLSFKNSFNLLLFYASMVFIYALFKFLYEKHGANFIFKLFGTYVVVALISGIVSLIQLYFFKTQGRVLPGVWPLPNRPTRYGSFFWDINHYAPYLVTIIPFLVIRGFFPKNAIRSIFYWVGFFFALAVLVMTLSRSGWLGIFVALCLVVPLLLYKRLFKTTAAYLFVLQLLSLGAVLGSIYLNVPIWQRLKSLTGLEYNDSIVAHGIITKGNFGIFTKYPVFGGGYGGFNEQFRQTAFAKKYFQYDPVEEAHLPAHSIWLETLSETGIIGFSLYLFLFILIIRLSFRAIRKAKEPRILATNIGLISSLVGILTSGFFYSYNLEYFWVFIFFVVFFARIVVREEKLDVRDFIISLSLLGFSAFFILKGLGKIKLIDWDESIYAEVSKNIIKYRDFITLHWVRDKPWFEKPPLYMWLTAITYWIFGISEVTARLWSALAGIAGVLGVYFFGKKLYNRQTGLAAALVLISTVHWLFQSRNGTLDVQVATLILLTLYFFWTARENKNTWFWMGLFLGLGFMTKGAVVVIPLFTMVVFALLEIFITHEHKKYLNKKILLSLVSFAIVVLPWHLASYLIHGKEFIDSYLLYHIFERTKGIEGHDNEWFWYFIVIKHWFRHWFVVLLPATLYFLVKIVKKFKDKASKECLRELFLITWAFMTLLIFSLSISKIQWYIMPIYPALALIVARFIGRFTFTYSRTLSFLVLFGLFLSTPYLLNRYKNMWDIPDNNLGVALLARQMNMITQNKPDAVLVYHGLSPGPAMFYSDRTVITTTDFDLMTIIDDRAPFYAIALKEDFERFIEHREEKLVAIFDEREGYVLFGRTITLPE